MTTSRTQTRTWLRRATAGSAALATAAAAMLAPAAAGAAIGSVSAPGGLKAERSAGDVNQLDITWKPVAGVDHYTVNVFDGSRDRAFTVPADRTSMSVPVSGACSRYNVTVTATSDEGTSAKTNVFRVEPLAPGGITALTATRDADSAKLSWEAPRSTGIAPLEGYQVQVRQLSNGKVLVDRNSPDPTEYLSGLDPERMYVAQISAENKYGSCITSKVVLQGNKPTAPRALNAVRAADDPDRLQLSWTEPEWAGFGKIDHYEIGFRSPSMQRPKWISVGRDLKAEVALDSKIKWSLWVRSVNSEGKEALGKELTVEKAGSALAPEVDPKVDIAESDGVITVDFAGPVGSSSKYPRMTVAVAPTLGGRGFRDAHSVSNSAGQVVFDRVPCGVYSVVVTGQGPKDSKEFGRKVLNRCDTGAITGRSVEAGLRPRRHQGQRRRHGVRQRGPRDEHHQAHLAGHGVHDHRQPARRLGLRHLDPRQPVQRRRPPPGTRSSTTPATRT